MAAEREAQRDQEVGVVGQNRLGQNAEARGPRARGESRHEVRPILLRSEDRLPIKPWQHEVVESPWGVEARPWPRSSPTTR